MTGQRQSRFDRSDDVVVMKFGGTSVEDAAAIRRLIGIVESRRNARPVVVVSALAKVTDHLVEAGKAASGGHLGAALALVRNIYVRHEALVAELVDGAPHAELDRKLRDEFHALESLLHEFVESHELDLKLQDRLLGFGECFSSRVIAEALNHAGIRATHIDARTCIVTDARHGQAAPLWEETNQQIQKQVEPVLNSGCVPVLGGFIAATANGTPTTLGRGGSDFTASILGAALGAARIEIWTDVDGIMTTDPKLCADARVIRKMSFDEAAEMAQLGAKVLHPATLAPAMRANIPVHVLNSRRPEGEGTEIVARARNGGGVSAVTVRRNLTAVEIESFHAISSELLNAVYAAFDRYGCQVDVMGASAGRLSLLVSSTASLTKVAKDLQDIADVRWEDHKALVCVVGENMQRQPEAASRAFAALSDMDVQAVCRGVSERTISFLVTEEQVEESVQRLHAAFFPRHEPSRDWGAVSVAFCQASTAGSVS